MHQIILAFFSSYIFVFLKAFQQRNVAFDNYFWVIPTSMSMGFVEYVTVFLIVKMGYNIPLILGAGLGAGLGALSAMLLHKKFLLKNDYKKEEGIQTSTVGT